MGGFIGVNIKTTSNKILSFILELAAGLMISIVCFDLIPEALELSNIYNVLVGVIIGVISMIICDNVIKAKFTKTKTSSLLKTGIIVGIGLAIHNFPEGLAIGSGFEASIKLGYSLAIAIALHDIPEGISMAVPMKNGGMSKKKALLLTFLSGITTGIGTLFGGIMGTISVELIALCLAFSAGAMLYIVSRRINTGIKKDISRKVCFFRQYTRVLIRDIVNYNKLV